MMINKGEKFVHNISWKAYFYLNPEKKPKIKENFGFKSTNPAPFVHELQPFKKKFIKFLKNVKYGRQPNHFQQELKTDVKKNQRRSAFLSI